jgi:hypothetical protein
MCTKLGHEVSTAWNDANIYKAHKSRGLERFMLVYRCLVVNCTDAKHYGVMVPAEVYKKCTFDDICLYRPPLPKIIPLDSSTNTTSSFVCFIVNVAFIEILKLLYLLQFRKCFSTISHWNFNGFFTSKEINQNLLQHSATSSWKTSTINLLTSGSIKIPTVSLLLPVPQRYLQSVSYFRFYQIPTVSLLLPVPRRYLQSVSYFRFYQDTYKQSLTLASLYLCTTQLW